VKLRYGTNPHQAAQAAPMSPGRWPVRVRHGEPSFINLLDALNGWQLVHQAAQVLGRPAAASFKHVSPAGAAVAGPVDEVTAELYGTAGRDLGAVTSAYLRARDADPKSSYGDFAAVSHPVDAELCEVLAGLVCDGVVAPGYAPGTAGKLSRKKKGRFLVLEADPGFVPPAREDREVFGLHLTQDRDHTTLSAALLDHTVTGGALPASAREDLLLGLAVLRFTQSNSVCYLRLLPAGRDDAGDRGRPAIPGRLHPAGRGEGGHLVAAAPPGGARACFPARHDAPGPDQRPAPVHRRRPHPG